MRDTIPAQLIIFESISFVNFAIAYQKRKIAKNIDKKGTLCLAKTR